VKSMPFQMRTAYDASERAVKSTVGQHRGRVGG
jgi:hypothetical protein